MPQLSEQTGFIILAVGVGIAVIGLVWLLIRMLPILRDIVVRGFRPMLVVLLGAGVASVPVVLNRLTPIDDRPKVNLTTGEQDITLTGKSGLDYAQELGTRSWTIIQMANPDVTDATVELLRSQAALKKLDLSDTAITDASVPILKGLPRLEVLRLARTRLSEAAIIELLNGLPNLTEIDVRGTAVPAKVLRDWKNAQPETRKYLR